MADLKALFMSAAFDRSGFSRDLAVEWRNDLARFFGAGLKQFRSVDYRNSGNLDFALLFLQCGYCTK